MYLIINLFSKLLAPTYYKFIQALNNPKAVQKSVQADIINRLIKSEYGQYLGIKSIEDWHHIPIVAYCEMENWIIKQQLTPEAIIFSEKTSGSRGAAKLIPYTKSLRRSFNQMFCVWAHDLIVNGCKFSTGKIYFCISPQLKEDTKTRGRTDAGTEDKENFSHSPTLQDDSEYLDSWLRWVLSPFLVSPPGINRSQTAAEFKHKLAKVFIGESKLEIISIWSPTFLKVILEYIQENRLQLHQELQHKISNDRAKLLLKPEIPWTQLWRELKLISCWDSAIAADSAEFLRKLFPNVLVQGKGLLATEAPMTIPLIKAGGCVPVLDEVFFEFEDAQGKIHLLHELEKGEVYEIIISQKGGLYRYRIGDRVRVTHFYLNTPCLEFLGRTQEISDLVGEKLHSEFVREVLAHLPLEGTSFKSLVPAKQPREHYVLLLDRLLLHPEAFAQMLDHALQKSPQYRHARLLGQLQPVRVLVSALIPEIVSLSKIKSGKKWGDLKHEILVTTPIENELLAELEKISES